MISVEEGKARRRAGMDAMTTAQKIRRDLTGGRPPASELKTPLVAVTAARTLYKELESRMTAAVLKPKPGDWAVNIAFVTPDLSVLGFTRLYGPGEEAGLVEMLTGRIAIGLIFGIVDREADKKGQTIVTGSRPFLATKQTEAWLSELLPAFPVEMSDPT